MEPLLPGPEPDRMPDPAATATATLNARRMVRAWYGLHLVVIGLYLAAFYATAWLRPDLDLLCHKNWAIVAFLALSWVACALIRGYRKRAGFPVVQGGELDRHWLRNAWRDPCRPNVVLTVLLMVYLLALLVCDWTFGIKNLPTAWISAVTFAVLGLLVVWDGVRTRLWEECFGGVFLALFGFCYQLRAGTVAFIAVMMLIGVLLEVRWQRWARSLPGEVGP